MVKVALLNKIFICVAISFLYGCNTVVTTFQVPESNVQSGWVNYGADNSLIQSQPQIESQWWRQFNDPTLDNLMVIGRNNSPTLQVAGVKVMRTLAQYDIAVSELFPQTQALTGGIDYDYLNSGIVDQIPGLDRDVLSNNLSVRASWELDIWGKYSSQIQAENADVLASVASYDDMLVSLYANIADAYISVRSLEAQIAAAEQNILLQRESYRIAKVRFEFGQVSELDPLQAKVQLANTEADLPVLKENLQKNKNKLAFLVGETPDKMDDYLSQSASLDINLPHELVVGIPQDILRRRPDVRQAEYIAASQSALIGYEKANLYPSFSLSGVFGFGSNNLGNNSLDDIFQWDRRTASAGLSFNLPIFNYGRIMDSIRVQDASFQEAILNYQNTVLNAQKEVEDALASYVYTKEQTGYLASAADASKRSADLSVLQYKEGQVSFTTVLSAAQARLETENAYIVARNNIIKSIISTYRALGGGWQANANDGFISEQTKQAMKSRVNWGDHLDIKESDVSTLTEPVSE